MEEQRRFLTRYEEVGQALLAAGFAKVSRSAHYRWLDQDPTYRTRFQAARLKACRRLEDEAVRRARYGVARMVLYKGKPVLVEGKPLYENKYSDRLMIKLLEAGDPDRFNRGKVAPLEGNLENLTEGQIRSLLGWLEQGIKMGEAVEALNGPGQQPGAEVAETVAREAEMPESPAPFGFVPPFRGADGWPYKIERKKRK